MCIRDRHTGRYYEILAHQLSEANLFVSTINPKLIKDFDNDSLRKVKSDKADAVKIARYALDKWQNLKQYNVCLLYTSSYVVCHV